MHARWLASVVAISLVLSINPRTAMAWQQVKSGTNGARVYASSSPDAAVSGNVGPGKPLTIADRPTNGFYRCNAGHGLNGWCAEADLDWGKGAPRASSGGGGGAGGGYSSGGWGRHGALESQIYAGALLGFGFWSAGTKFTFGADGGYKLNSEWGLGLYLNYVSLGSSTVGTITASASTFIVAPELNYFLPGELRGLHLGGKLGLAFSSASLTAPGGVLPAGTASGSSTGLVFGVGAAYDYPIAQSISVGGEANFLILTSSAGSTTTTGGTTTTSSGSASVFNILATAKYWL
jgi:hypothetical protein